MKFRRILAAAIAAACVGGGVSVALVSSATASTNGEPCYEQVETVKHRWKRNFGGQKQVKGWEYSDNQWHNRRNNEWYTIPAHLNPPFYGNVSATGQVPLSIYGGPNNVTVEYRYPTPGTEWYPSETGYATEAEFEANATGGGWSKVETKTFTENGDRIPCTDKPDDGKETKSEGACEAPGATTVTVTNSERTYTWTYNNDTEEWDKSYGPWTETGTTERPLSDEEQASATCRPPDDYEVVEWTEDCADGGNVVKWFSSVTAFTFEYDAGDPPAWKKVVVATDETSGERSLTEEEQSACQPTRDPRQDREDVGEPECGDTTIAVKVTTTTYSYTYENGVWVEHTSQAVTYETRDLDESEQTECELTEVVAAAPTFVDPTCEAIDGADVVLPSVAGVTYEVDGDIAPGTEVTVTATALAGYVLTGTSQWNHTFADPTTTGCSSPPPPEATIDLAAFSPVCQADIPYIDYRILVSGTDNDTATLTFIDNKGAEIEVHRDVPLTGRVIYPGASEAPDWPGWTLNSAGLWVVDPTDQHWRDGLRVRVEVNPTVTSSVSYPAATAACNGPDAPPATTTTTTVVASSASLPPTGSSSTTPLVLVALGMVVTGLAMLTVKRRDHTS